MEKKKEIDLEWVIPAWRVAKKKLEDIIMAMDVNKEDPYRMMKAIQLHDDSLIIHARVDFITYHEKSEVAKMAMYRAISVWIMGMIMNFDIHVGTPEQEAELRQYTLDISDDDYYMWELIFMQKLKEHRKKKAEAEARGDVA